MTEPPVTVRAAVLPQRGAPFEIRELLLEPPRADELVVRTVATGVCHTDSFARDGHYPVPVPVVLGHEGAGVVEAVGADVHDVRVGDHVVLSFAHCGRCPTCRAGRPALCRSAYEQNFAAQRADGSTPLSAPDGSPVHGMYFGQSSFSTAALAPAASAVVVDDDVDLTVAAPFGCGFQTGAGAVLNSLAPAPGSSIAVFGAGTVGLCAVMAAVIAGCSTVVAVDRNPARLALAEELGATHVLEAGERVLASLRQIGGGGVDSALDTTGHPGVVRQAVDALHVAGTFALVGSSALGTEVTLDMPHMLFGRTFRGVIEGDSVPREFIPQLIEHHRAGRFPVDRLVRRFPFDQIEAAVAAAERGEVVKPVLTFA